MRDNAAVRVGSIPFIDMARKVSIHDSSVSLSVSGVSATVEFGADEGADDNLGDIKRAVFTRDPAI